MTNVTRSLLFSTVFASLLAGKIVYAADEVESEVNETEEQDVEVVAESKQSFQLSGKTTDPGFDESIFDVEDAQDNAGNHRRPEMFGVNVSPQDLSVEIRHTDFHLPLNGPDITIARKFDPQYTANVPAFSSVLQNAEIFDWVLDIPKIYLTWNIYFPGMLDSCGRTNIRSMQVEVPGVPGFDLVGKDSTVSYPDGTIYVFENNWLLLCSSYDTRSNSTTSKGVSLDTAATNGLSLLAPDGTIYRFAFSDTYAPNPSNYGHDDDPNLDNNYRTFFVTDVEDKFGNWLAYDYKADLTLFWREKLTLLKIRSSEGPEVNFNVQGSQIKGFTYGNREIVYTSKTYEFSQDVKTRHVLHSVTYKDSTVDDSETPVDPASQEVWTYNYSEFEYQRNTDAVLRRGLTQIQNPWGGVLDIKYTYQPFRCGSNMDHDNYHASVPYAADQLRISGAGIEPYTVNYSTIRNKVSERATTTITYDDRKEKHTFHCSTPEKESLQEKWARKIYDYKDIKLEVLTKLDAVVSSTTFDWLEIILPDHVEAYEQDKTGPNRLVQKEINRDGNFKTEYQDFDAFGIPRKTVETNTRDKLKKYTKHTFFHNKDNWYIGLPSKTEISDDDIDYVVTEEFTYHDATVDELFDDLGLLYEEKLYGTWIARHVDYHVDGNETHGLVKKTEFNKKLLKSDGKESDKLQYTQYLDYKRSQPREIKVAKRYSELGTVSVQRSIDNFGQTSSIVDANNNLTHFGYDALGRMAYKDVTSDNQKWLDTLVSWRALADGTFVKTQKRCNILADKSDCVENTHKYTEETNFDGLMRVTLLERKDVAKNNSRFQLFAYNSRGLQTFKSFHSTESDESKGVTTGYDELGRTKTVTITDSGTTTQTYVHPNKVRVEAAVTDTLNNVTTTTYLSYGEPMLEQPISILSKVSESENVTTSLDVDVFGNILSITQTGLNALNEEVSATETRGYDARKRLCKITRPEFGATIMGYNNLDQVVWKENGVVASVDNTCTHSSTNENRILFTYDNLGEIWEANYPDGTPDQEFKYDNNGNLEYVKSNNGTSNVQQSYTYNGLNLIEANTLTTEGKRISPTATAASLDYEYDGMGHLSSLTYPNGDVVSYMPNAFGEATMAQRQQHADYDSDNPEHDFKAAFSYASQAAYYPNGVIDTFIYGNNQITHKTALNSRQLPERVTDKISSGNTQRLDYGYTFDFNLNVKSITDHLDDSYSLTLLTYDGLDRLTSTSGNSSIGSSQIEYDGLNNIVSYQSKNSSLAYTYNYKVSDDYDDGKANLLREVVGSGTSAKTYPLFEYDMRGNVTNNTFNIFSYNQANQMVSALAGGDVTHTYLYDGHNRRVKQTDKSGTSYSLYGLDGTLLYREKEGLGVNYIYLGKKLVAKDGFIEETQDAQHYRPFGDSIEGSTDGIGYTGHKFDKSLGLSYMQARYYDPVIGRFYSNDPVGFDNVHNFNRYAYANNNPYKYIDPDGNYSTKAHTFIINAALPGNPSAFAVAKGSADFDRVTQSTELSHYHNLRQKGESAISMINKRADFVSAMKTAIKSIPDRRVGGKNSTAAHELFGALIHPIMDKYSPAHNDSEGNPLEWNPLSILNLAETLNHSPVDWLGGEGTDNLNSEDIKGMKNEIRNLYQELFSEESSN